MEALLAAHQPRRDERRVWVTLTFAQSSDGKIAGPGKTPLRLSGADSMVMTHRLRALHEGILVGIGTVLVDNPRLDVRLDAYHGPSPRPIVLDRHLRMPVTCRLLQRDPPLQPRQRHADAGVDAAAEADVAGGAAAAVSGVIGVFSRIWWSRRMAVGARPTTLLAAICLGALAGVVVLLFVAWQMWIGDIIIAAQKNEEGAAISQQLAAGEAPEPPPLIETDDGETVYQAPVPAAPADATLPAIDYSFAGRIGHAMTAIFAPLGFNWQICIALVPGMAAREVAGWLDLTVADTGPGFSPEALARGAEPFFTTKGGGRAGSGLGLSMVYDHAKRAGGTLHLANSATGGLVRLRLPLRRIAPQLVLLVEDDNAVRAASIQTFQLAGIEAKGFGAAEPVRDMIHPDFPGVIVTDVRLPGMNGLALLDHAMRVDPKLPVVLITGYAEQAATRLDCLAPGMQLMTKPFSLELLAETVARAIATPVG